VLLWSKCLCKKLLALDYLHFLWERPRHGSLYLFWLWAKDTSPVLFRVLKVFF
jgi:hypothetical protein